MLLILAFITIALSVILAIHNWRINKTAIFLALFFIVLSIYGIAHYFTIYGKSVFWLAVFYSHFTPFMLLMGPFLFFYVRGTLTDQQGLRRKDAIHFIPILVHFVGLVPYYLKPFSEKEEFAKAIIKNIDAVQLVQVNLFFTTSENFIMRPTLLFAYSCYLLALLWKFAPGRNKLENVPRKQYLITYRWLLILVISVLILVISYFIFTVDALHLKPSIGMNTAKLFLAISGFTFAFLPLSLLLFPQILYGIPIYQNKIPTNSLAVKQPSVKIQSPVASTNAVIEDLEEDNPFAELAVRINDFLKEERPYLKPDFSIADISIALKVPQNHIAYCFSAIFKTKFIKLRTQLRIYYAKELLESGSYNNLTIDAIAQKSGFTSRSNFYIAFKTEIGSTPSDYLKNLAVQ